MNRYCVILGMAAMAAAARSDAAAHRQVLSGDVPLCLAAEPHEAGDAGAWLWVGCDSGRVLCYRVSGDGFQERWSAQAGSSVLAVLPLADLNGDGLTEVVAATDAGQVVCLPTGGSRHGRPIWTVESSCNVSALARLEDADGDGVPEVAAGGADHRVRLLGGRDGRLLWTRLLESRLGGAYITRIVNGSDLNADSKADAVVWTWSGELCALSGANGKPIWSQKVDQGFTEGLARLADEDGDGLPEFLAGGNGRSVYLCTGRNGSVQWSVKLDRPVRDVTAPADKTRDGAADCFVVTAGGTVACVPVGGADRPRWTASLGDVGRAVISPGDLDGDGTADAVACAENGVTAAFSGRNGRLVWRWQGPDVARTLCNLGDVDGDRISDVAVAHLDGTLAVLSGRSGGAGLPAIPPRESPDSVAPPRQRRPNAAGPDPRHSGGAEAVPILLYHDVLPEAIYRYSTSVDDFRAQMDALVQGGYRCVSLDEIADWIEGRGDLPPRPVCITFDGPYDGHHTHAFPILKERGLFAASYITTDWIGTANHADWHQLREMDAAGIMDVQNHSLSHPLLTRVGREEAIAQLSGSNEAIARRLDGKRARHHAYPSGEHGLEVHRILRDLGFRTATTVQSAHATRESDLMTLPRYTVTNATTLDEFKRMIRWREP